MATVCPCTRAQTPCPGVAWKSSGTHTSSPASCAASTIARCRSLFALASASSVWNSKPAVSVPWADAPAQDMLEKIILPLEEELSTVADLMAYNTASNAADINDLRLALGYDQVNLWGGSYGTRLALGVMRDYPEGLRSVVLDSVYPPDVDLYMELQRVGSGPKRRLGWGTMVSHRRRRAAAFSPHRSTVT